MKGRVHIMDEERPRRNYWKARIVRQGVSFGSALAMILSYTKNASIFWAIVHGLCSWVYVLYRFVLQIWFS